MQKKQYIFNTCLAAVFAAGCGPTAGVQPQSVGADEVKTVRLGQKDVTPQPRPAMPGVNVPAIKVNTVGYPVDWNKMIIFNVDPKGAIITDSDDNEVMTITDDMVTHYGLDQASKDPVWQVDITALETPGVYTARVGEHQSDPFGIDGFEALYHTPIKAFLKSFYFQRTRTALELPYAEWEGTEYTREGVSHVYDDVGWDHTYYPEKKQKWQTHPEKQWWPGEQLKKGWHDAGNYDMYIPSTAPVTQAVLYAYLAAPELFPDGGQNIPESGNGVPDILDESTWALDWILSLQQKDGAFRHSEAVQEWGGKIPADQDTMPRWIRGVSSSATAKAVAVLAMAAQIYKEFPEYEEMAQMYEKAAKLGWEWVKANPDHVKPDPKGSPQPLWDDGKDGRGDKGARFIAATNMWIWFRDEDALAKIRRMIFDEKLPEVTDIQMITTGAWVNVSRYGLIDLALDEETPEDIRTYATNILVKCADEFLLPRAAKDGHKVVTSINEYYWGHNANLAEKVHQLAMTAKITGDDKYMEVARDQWHWLMGRNPNSYAMATRVGKGVTAFYHMEWGDASPPPPGYVIGGPNYSNLPQLAPDMPAKALLWDNPTTTRSGTPPGAMFHWHQTSMWDGGFVAEESWDEGWWAVTETDIQYNCDFLLAGVIVR